MCKNVKVQKLAGLTSCATVGANLELVAASRLADNDLVIVRVHRLRTISKVHPQLIWT